MKIAVSWQITVWYFGTLRAMFYVIFCPTVGASLCVCRGGWGSFERGSKETGWYCPCTDLMELWASTSMRSLEGTLAEKQDVTCLVTCSQKLQKESISVSGSECLDRLCDCVSSLISANKTIWLLSCKVTFQYYRHTFCLSLKMDHWLNLKHKRTDTIDEVPPVQSKNEASSSHLKKCCCYSKDYTCWWDPSWETLNKYLMHLS